jgi:predicted transposase/invertase (TIGR01784 family)
MFATKLEQYREELKREARQDGKKEGMEEGLEKGREERALRVARRLLERGESISDVAEITELSEERVRDIQANPDHPS